MIWEDHFYPEIIDPVSGEVLPEGQPGGTGVHLADQTRRCRDPYRTRDLTRLLPPPTALDAPRIGKITGRSDDMLIIRGQRLSVPDRGTDPQTGQAVAAPCWKSAATAHLDSLKVKMSR